MGYSTRTKRSAARELARLPYRVVYEVLDGELVVLG